MQSGFDSCDTFGSDDFFMNGDTDLIYSIDLSLMCDPFGGSGEFGGFGGMGWAGSEGDACERCRNRNIEACKSDKSSCVARVGAISVGIVAGCLWTAPGELICGVVAIILGIAGGIECSSTYDACILRVDNNCPTCNQ